MTDELRLPARRELPPEVHDRLRAAVTAGLARPTSRRGRVLAVAAAVALLVTGAAVCTQIARSRPGEVPAGAATLSSRTLDRCWAGVRSARKTDRVPARSDWVTVSLAEQGDDIVVAFTAGGKPMFCETTSTTVTLSDPDAAPSYAPGSRTGLLLYTSTGLVAGVADPAWARVELSLRDGLGVSMSDVTKATRQFSSFTLTDPATTRLWAGRWDKGQTTRSWPRAALPPAPAPLFSLVDRPGERSSPAGKALGACLAGVAQPPADRDAYQPGAMLQDGPYRVVLGRAAGHTVACTAEPDPTNPAITSYQVYRDAFVGQSIPVRRLSVPGLSPDGAKVPFVGIVPPSGASMVADFAIGKPVNVAVVNGTFAVWLPAGAKPLSSDGTVWVRTLDGRGTTLFNGYVPLK
jgi:hypothetical protein